MRNYRAPFALAIAAAFSTLFNTPEANAMFRRTTSTKRYRHNWQKPHDGEQERERRRRQIAKGQLTESNGLIRQSGGVK